jgi:hypothetical protein
MAHLLYNADGRDIKASVKFIMQQYQKLGGAGGAAAPVGRV